VAKQTSALVLQDLMLEELRLRPSEAEVGGLEQIVGRRRETQVPGDKAGVAGFVGGREPGLYPLLVDAIERAVILVLTASEQPDAEALKSVPVKDAREPT
jgi:hypothetical protein